MLFVNRKTFYTHSHVQIAESEGCAASSLVRYEEFYPHGIEGKDEITRPVQNYEDLSKHDEILRTKGQPNLTNAVLPRISQGNHFLIRSRAESLNSIRSRTSN